VKRMQAFPLRIDVISSVCIAVAGVAAGSIATYCRHRGSLQSRKLTAAKKSISSALRLRGAGTQPAAINLGIMKIPLEGTFSHIKFTFGLVFAMTAVAFVFSVTQVQGPAVMQGSKCLEACKQAILANCAWCYIYYNYLGAMLLGKFTQHVWQMYSDKDVTETYEYISSRFAGNMQEHSAIFLSSLWMYTMFADSATGGTLGLLYIATRIIYPLFYIFYHGFDLGFECMTQTGYGVIGVFMLGSVYSAVGGDWVAFATGNPITAGVSGFWLGSLALSMGIPLGLPYAFLHYKVDHALAKTKKQ